MDAGKFFILGIIIVSLSFLVSSQSLQPLTTYSSIHQPGETVQAELITGPLIQPITAADISLLDAQQKKMSIAPFLWNIAENHYALSFDLPLTTQNGNYTLQVQAAKKDATKVAYSQVIGVEDLAVPILSIKQAFFFFEEGQQTMVLNVENKKTTTTVNITASPGITHLYSAPQIIQEGTTRAFKFSLQNATEKESIQIAYQGREYTIPVFITPKAKSTANASTTQPISKQKSVLQLQTAVAIVNRTITPTQKISGMLSFKNTGNETLANITLSLTGNLQDIIALNQTGVEMLGPMQAADIFVTVNQQEKSREGIYEGSLIIAAGVHRAELPFFIVVSPPQQTVLPDKTILENDTGDELEPFNFTFPDSGQTKKKRSLKGIGSFLFTVFFLLLAGIFFYIKNKKTTEKRTFQEYLRERQKKP